MLTAPMPPLPARAAAPARAAIAAALLLAAPPAPAAVRTWMNPVDGDFLDPANWKEGAAPGPIDTVVFGETTGGPFTVLAPDGLIGELRIRNQSVVLDLAGGAFEVWDQARVAYGSGDTASLTISGGSFTANYLAVASPVDSTAEAVFSNAGVHLSGALVAGGSGHGLLRVEGGAAVDTQAFSVLGSAQGSGRAIFTGPGSVLRAETILMSPNQRTDSAWLEVADGARLEADLLTIVGPGAELLGDSAVHATVAANGLIRPGRSSGAGGTLTIEGDLNFEQDGLLRIEAYGPSSAACTRLDVTGDCSFAHGGLLFVPTSGYAPAPGDRFDVVGAATVRPFAGVRGADLGGGLTFRPEYTADSVSVTIARATGLSLSAPSVFHGFHGAAAASAALEGGGTLDAAWSVQWSVDDPSIASISDRGVMLGLAPGRTTLRASFAGLNASTPLVVLALPEPLAMTLANLAAGSGKPVSALDPSASADGRFVVFRSASKGMVPDDDDSIEDVFIRDRAAGTTERLSVSPGGGPPDKGSDHPDVSDDGRFVVFQSDATNLVAGDTNGKADIFVRDRATGTNERVSVSSSGAQADQSSFECRISSDGRLVVFGSGATNLVAGDTNGKADIFVRDRAAGATTRVSVSSSGAQANDSSQHPNLSPDGRFIIFLSGASNLVASDTNGRLDFFIRDRAAGVTERLTVSTGGAQSAGLKGDYLLERPSVSADGRFAAFHADTPDLVPGDTNGLRDVFLRDRAADTTVRLSIAPDGSELFGESTNPEISEDGSVVAFLSEAPGVVAGLTDPRGTQFYLRDVARGRTSLISQNLMGEPADEHAWRPPTLCGGGRFAVFHSDASNLVPFDPYRTGAVGTDIFVCDLYALCPADFNRDGRLNINDFIAFQSAFRAADPRTDVNRDGKVNINDFIAFHTAFHAGC